MKGKRREGGLGGWGDKRDKRGIELSILFSVCKYFLSCNLNKQAESVTVQIQIVLFSIACKK